MRTQNVAQLPNRGGQTADKALLVFFDFTTDFPGAMDCADRLDVGPPRKHF
jgi:hypothetical protein